MSDPTVSVSVSFGFGTAYRANLALARFLPTTVVIAVLFACGGLFLFYVPFSLGRTPSLYETFVALLALFFLPLVSALTLFLVRQKNAFAQGPFKYTFSDEGLQIDGPLVSSTTKWPAVRRVAETRSFIFMFVATRKAQCLPKTGIAEDRLTAIRAILKRHCP